MEEIKEIIQGYKLTYISEKTGININTLQDQLSANNVIKLTLENELKIRQAFTK